MRIEFHPSMERGHLNHGWLDTWHSFSFAEYFNPIHNRFGLLRVLNDDIIQGGRGFGEHPHENMEIISIPLEGELEHRDSLGHVEVIKPGDVQLMTAGSGVRHSEYNHSATEACNFLQIWIFPRSRNLVPRYEQKTFNFTERLNRWQLLVTPDTHHTVGTLWICQDAWLSVTKLEAGKKLDYSLHMESNQVFAFVIEGLVMIAGHKAIRRDAIAITECSRIETESLHDSEILIIEIPGN